MAKTPVRYRKAEQKTFVYETIGFEILGVPFDPRKSHADNYQAASEAAWNRAAQLLTDALTAAKIKFVGPFSARSNNGVAGYYDQNGQPVDPPEDATPETNVETGVHVGKKPLIVGGEEARIFVYETLGFEVCGVGFDPAKSYDENYEAASEAASKCVGQLLTDVLVQNKVKFGGPFCARENGAWPSFADQNGQMVPPPEPDWNVEAEYYRRSLQNDDTQNYPNICLSAAVCFAWVTDESNLAKAMQGVVASMAEEWSNDAPTADEFADFMAQSSIFALPNDSRDATFWMTLADELERRWPDAAVVYYCRGSVAENTGDMVGAIDGFVSALEIDETFWAASWSCGAVYSQQRNYRTAAGYFRRALDEPGAQSKPDIWSQAAWCFLRTKDYAEAVDAYRRCLELAPDYRYATNDLGWSLIRAGKYEEAVEILSDAVERNIDGKYPIRNLAAALQKLGRYDEAIDTLRKDVTKTGGLSANAERRIAKLKELLAKPESERSSALEIEADEEIELVEEPHVDDEETVEDDEVQQAAATRITASVIATARPKVAGASMPLERILEDLLEEKIRRGERVFGRGLMIYSSQDGRKYGRQFAIPGVGIIDVLAVDVETNELVVIELKRDQADRDVVGQTSHYKGWVAANLAGPGQSVVGIICVRDAAPSLRIAAAGAGLEVHHFNLSFDKL